MPHIHEKVDFTVEVFVVYGNKVLLRKHDKYKIWLSVGGHIELGEDPNEAAIREVKEEVGLDILLADDLLPFREGDPAYRELIPPKFLNKNKISDTHGHVTMTYFATAADDEIREPASAEISDGCRWFTREELDDPSYGVKTHIGYYAKQALDELGV